MGGQKHGKPDWNHAGTVGGSKGRNGEDLDGNGLKNKKDTSRTLSGNGEGVKEKGGGVSGKRPKG